MTLVSAMLLARIRTLEENGTYSSLLLIINLAVAIFMLGLPNSINYFLAKAETRTQKNSFLSIYYTFSTILSAVLGLVLVVLIPVWVLYFDNGNLAQYWFFLLIFPWAKVITASIENVLVVLGQSSMLVKYRISNSIILLLIIILVGEFDFSFRTYMLLYVLIEGFYAIAVYVLVSKYTGKLHAHFDWRMIKRVLEFSIPLGFASIVGTLNIEIDKLMLGHFLSTENLAIYTNASKEMPLTIVATSLTAVLMPKMVKLFQQNRNREAVDIWRDVTSISFAVIAFFGIGMAVFATEAMTILYSEKYASGAPVFAIYSLGLLLKCTYFGIVLNTTGKTKIVFYSSIATLCLNSLMNVVLYKTMGVTGPALATLLSSGIIGMLQIWFSSKIIGIKFVHIFPWKNMAIIVLLNLVLGAVFYIIHIKFFSGCYQAIVLAALWGIIYGLILLKPAKRYWTRLRSV